MVNTSSLTNNRLDNRNLLSSNSSSKLFHRISDTQHRAVDATQFIDLLTLCCQHFVQRFELLLRLR